MFIGRFGDLKCKWFLGLSIHADDPFSKSNKIFLSFLSRNLNSGILLIKSCNSIYAQLEFQSLLQIYFTYQMWFARFDWATTICYPLPRTTPFMNNSLTLFYLCCEIWVIFWPERASYYSAHRSAVTRKYGCDLRNSICVNYMTLSNKLEIPDIYGPAYEKVGTTVLSPTKHICALC